MNDPKLLKLYIAVLDAVPDHMVPVIVAHAVLGAHRTFDWHNGVQADKEYMDWLTYSFKKVVVRVNRKEFNKITTNCDLVFCAHESTVLKGENSCVVVCPRYEIPNVLKFAKMWAPNPIVLYSPHFTNTDNPIDLPAVKFYNDDELQ